MVLHLWRLPIIVPWLNIRHDHIEPGNPISIESDVISALLPGPGVGFGQIGRARAVPLQDRKVGEDFEIVGFDQHKIITYAVSNASATQVVISVGVGMRPNETTFSLMTNPGLDRML